VKLVLVVGSVLGCCVLGAGCSAANLNRPDAGLEDTGTVDVSEAGTDAGMCGPLDVTKYTSDVMHSPNPAHANKCTTEQAADYAACESGDSTKCGEFQVGESAYTCGQCIESQNSDTHWGVVVFENTVGTLNTPGCIDDALEQTPEEKDQGGNGSCGDLLYAELGCETAACNACIGDSLITCGNESIAHGGGCATYDTAFGSPTGMCAALFGDAAPPAADNCFPDENLSMNVAAQRSDWITRMATYMCGP
jgi:hypothetical protein